MRKYGLFIVGLLFIFFLTQCEQEKEFKYDVHLLTGKHWGIPEVLERGPSSEPWLPGSPTVFYKDGRVSFGGRLDSWQVLDSESLLIQQRKENWQVLELTENKLLVEVLSHPEGQFIVRAVFYNQGPAE